jgi:hypothetical protein
VFLRIAGIAAFCGTAVYLTSAAFVPSMETGGWDFLFIGFALIGVALGIVAAASKRRKDDPPEN